MHYFIAIELPKKDEDTAYGVVVPDIPGCFSAGDTLEEAIANAEEAIVLQLEDMIERKLDLPEPSPPEALAKKYRGWMFVGVDVDPQQLSTKAQRINITMPEGILYMVDQTVKRNHTTRSAFLADAAMEAISRSRLQGGDSITVESKPHARRKKGDLVAAQSKPHARSKNLRVASKSQATGRVKIAARKKSK